MTGTVVELLLVCDVPTPSGGVESCLCYAELKVSSSSHGFIVSFACVLCCISGSPVAQHEEEWMHLGGSNIVYSV